MWPSPCLVVLLLVLAALLVPRLVGGDDPPAVPARPTSSRDASATWTRAACFPSLTGTGVRWRSTRRAAGVQAVAAGEIDSFYVIPADYLQSGKVEQYAEFPGRFPSNPEGETILRALLAQGLVAGRVDDSVTTRVLAPAEYANYRVQEDGTAAAVTPAAAGGGRAAGAHAVRHTAGAGRVGGLQLHAAERRRREGEPAGRSGGHLGVAHVYHGRQAARPGHGRPAAGGGVDSRRGAD